MNKINVPGDRYRNERNNIVMFNTGRDNVCFSIMNDVQKNITLKEQKQPHRMDNSRFKHNKLC